MLALELIAQAPARARDLDVGAGEQRAHGLGSQRGRSSRSTISANNRTTLSAVAWVVERRSGSTPSSAWMASVIADETSRNQSRSRPRSAISAIGELSNGDIQMPGN